MKTIILAGGFGTRISEESALKPKPMVEIGGQPILWHIMKIYSAYGFNDFIICAGYKQHMIKEYFADYYLHQSDITFDFRAQNKMLIHHNQAEPWKVTVVDTGLHTMTGGRLKRVREYIEDEEFMLTYGDGVTNVPLDKLLAFHHSHGKIGTLTAIQPEGRFGILDLDEQDSVNAFREKNQSDTGYINGGFMIFRPEIFSYLKDDTTVLEREPLESLAREGELKAFKHDGFWQCMDTLRDSQKLEKLWLTGNAPWKVWKDK